VRLHGRRYDCWFSDDPAMPPSERYNYLYTEQELEPWLRASAIWPMRAIPHSSSPTIIFKERES